MLVCQTHIWVCAKHMFAAYKEVDHMLLQLLVHLAMCMREAGLWSQANSVLQVPFWFLYSLYLIVSLN